MSGHEDTKSFMGLSYVDTDVFLLFSYESVNTLESIRPNWVPEIARYLSKWCLFV